MKTTAASLQFCDLTSVAEVERFHKDIMAQSDSEFEFTPILSISDEMNLITIKIRKIYPPKGTLNGTSSDIHENFQEELFR